jgi:hypothetical protein
MCSPKLPLKKKSYEKKKLIPLASGIEKAAKKGRCRKFFNLP